MDKRKITKIRRITKAIVLPLPEKQKSREHNGWWINGYMEVQHEGRTYYHYCLERKYVGHNAMVRRQRGMLVGRVMKDDDYYRLGVTREEFIKAVD